MLTEFPISAGGGGPAELTNFGGNIFLTSGALAGESEDNIDGTLGFPSPSGRFPVDRAGALEGFGCTIAINTLNASMVVDIAINGTPTAISVTYAAGEVGTKTFDGAGIPVAVSDVLSIRAVHTSTVGAVQGQANQEFVPTG